MSTEQLDRRRGRGRRRSRAFVAGFAIVVAVLAVVGLGTAAASVAIGPRVTSVDVDPSAAVEASGSRLIVTMSQSVAEVDPSQVTVTPETPVAVDTSGRSIGVRFTLPLWDETEYTVTIKGVEGIGGGSATTIVESFTTPPLGDFLLQRGDGEDTIFFTGIDGEDAVPVFTHPHIEDFRATSSHLVISTLTPDDTAALIVTDRAGKGARELPLPGFGFISNLQVADRGETIGYTFTDASVGEGRGDESVLYTASAQDAAGADAPVAVQVSGADPRVADYRFVPDTASVLLLSFDGTLLLTDETGANATALGSALEIDGIARGTSVAVVNRFEATVQIDLTTAEEQEIVEADPATGPVSAVAPLPDGSTLRTNGLYDIDGALVGSEVTHVAVDGAATPIIVLDTSDAVIQTCVSPNARYAAILVAPDAASNPYDEYLLPLPQRVETRIVQISDAEPVVSLAGSSISWCQVPPR